MEPVGWLVCTSQPPLLRLPKLLLLPLPLPPPLPLPLPLLVLVAPIAATTQAPFADPSTITT